MIEAGYQNILQQALCVILGLMRSLATLPHVQPKPLVVTDKDGRPQEDPLAVHFFLCEAVVNCWGISLW